MKNYKLMARGDAYAWQKFFMDLSNSAQSTGSVGNAQLCFSAVIAIVTGVLAIKWLYF